MLLIFCVKVLAFKAKISAKITLDIKSAEFSLLFIREFLYFFVYCGSNFEGKKDLTFCGYRVNIPPTANSPSKFLCSGSIFMTTYRPTVFFGADGNSGLGSAEEHSFPSGKGRKKLFLAEIALIGSFGRIRPAG